MKYPALALTMMLAMGLAVAIPSERIATPNWPLDTYDVHLDDVYESFIRPTRTSTTALDLYEESTIYQDFTGPGTVLFQINAKDNAYITTHRSYLNGKTSIIITQRPATSTAANFKIKISGLEGNYKKIFSDSATDLEVDPNDSGTVYQEWVSSKTDADALILELHDPDFCLTFEVVANDDIANLNVVDFDLESVVRTTADKKVTICNSCNV